MKKNIFKTTFSLLVLSVITCFVFTACSEDLTNDITPKDGMERISFSINEKDYEAPENVTDTRAVVQSQTEVQNLGNGWQAEVSLVPDTTRNQKSKVTTRAFGESRHYTIRAYQGSTLKGEIKGTFDGSSFTPDTSDSGEMHLPHGYYDFICFSDGITISGTTLIVNRTDIPSAFYAIERNVLVNQEPKQKVAFTAKHAGAKVLVQVDFLNCSFLVKANGAIVRTISDPLHGGTRIIRKFTAVDPANDFSCLLETATNAIPEKIAYDFTANTYTDLSMGQISQTGGLDGEGEENSNYGFTSQELYDGYLLPTTDCSKLKLTFTAGELYGRSLVGKTITIPTHKLVEANKPYRIIIRLVMENMYLYDDGTFGFFDKNPGKTAIGIIYEPLLRYALALKDVVVSGNSNIQWANTTSQESWTPLSNYADLFLQTNNASARFNNISKQAVHDFQVSLPGGLPCRIPTLQDLLTIGSNIGKMSSFGKSTRRESHDYTFLVPEGASATDFTPSPTSIIFPEINMTRFNAAFTRVGGDPMIGSYWTNTECKDGSEYKQPVITILGNRFSMNLISKNSTAKIRPIISY